MSKLKSKDVNGNYKTQDELKYAAMQRLYSNCQSALSSNKNTIGPKDGSGGETQQDKQDKRLEISDECGDSMVAMMVQDAVKKTNVKKDVVYNDDGDSKQFKSATEVQNDVRKQITDNKAYYEKKYGCTIDQKKLANYQSLQQIVNMAAQTGAQISSDKAVYETNKDVANGGNAFRAGLENHGNNLKSVGTQQIGGAAIKAMMAAEAGRIASTHKKAAEDMKNYYKNSEDEGMLADDRPLEDNKPRDFITTTQNLDVAEHFQGHTIKTDEMQEKHEALSEEAKGMAIQTGYEALMSAINGANLIKQGNQMLADSKKVYGLPPAPPQTFIPQGNPNNINLQPGQFGFGSNGGPNEAPVTDGGLNQSTPEDTAKADIPPPILGNPTGGGLKDAPPPAGGGLVATSGGSVGGGGSGGGGGGGGSGGGSGNSSENTNPTAPSLQGGVSKFDSTGGGGGGFASTGNGNSNRVNSTGSMNFNEMLAKFLPKQGGEEEKDPKAKGILFDGPQGARGLASEPMDPSILGPNSNLFKRVSGAMLSHLKRGNLR